MSRTARVSSIKEGLALSTIAVPVTMRDGAGTINDEIVQSGVSVPTSLSAEWCRQQGLKSDAGSAALLRSMNGANIVLVSLGASASIANYRLAGAAAARAAGEGSLAFFLATGGLTRPADVAQSIVEGALLASYNYKS